MVVCVDGKPVALEVSYKCLVSALFFLYTDRCIVDQTTQHDLLAVGACTALQCVCGVTHAHTQTHTQRGREGGRERERRLFLNACGSFWLSVCLCGQFADRYDVCRLKCLVEEYLLKRVNLDNVLETLRYTHAHKNSQRKRERERERETAASIHPSIHPPLYVCVVRTAHRCHADRLKKACIKIVIRHFAILQAGLVSVIDMHTHTLTLTHSHSHTTFTEHTQRSVSFFVSFLPFSLSLSLCLCVCRARFRVADWRSCRSC